MSPSHGRCRRRRVAILALLAFASGCVDVFLLRPHGQTDGPGPGADGAVETNLIANGGFEKGLDGWTNPTGLVSPSGAGHSGAAALELSGTSGSPTAAIEQSVALPASGRTTLSFWYQSQCSGANLQSAVIVYSDATGMPSTLEVLRTCEFNTWKQVVADLTALDGTTVKVRFVLSQLGGTALNDLLVDDVGVFNSP
jgi:hypothetical protein